MRNSGISIIGILFTLVFISLIGIMVIKYVGVNTSDSNSKKLSAPIENAKGVECTLKFDGLNREVSTFRMTSENYPASLDEITSDTTCPVYGVQLDYNQTTGNTKLHSKVNRGGDEESTQA